MTIRNSSALRSLTLFGLVGIGLAASLPSMAQSSPEAQVDALEGLFGVQPTFRRSGAKGVCATGYFEGNAEGQRLSTASVFKGQRVPAVIRFSVGGGSPKASDKSVSVRGLAVSLQDPSGQEWQMATISAPVFFVAKPEQFAPFLTVRRPDPATGKPNPEALKAFNAANPETLRQAAYLAKTPVPASYGTAQYWSANAFVATSPSGARQAIRYQFVPEAGVKGLSMEELAAMPAEFLADDLRARVAKGPVGFQFQFQLAKSGDPTHDPTQAWPDDREVKTVGRLVVTGVEQGRQGACEAMTFNPLVLPTGVDPSDDPVLLARSASYAVGLGRRLGETAR